MHKGARLSSSICGARFTTMQLAGNELICLESRLSPIESTSCIPGRGSTTCAIALNPVLQSAHRGINERFTRQAIPRKVQLDPAKAVVEWAGVVKLRRPVRTLEIELLWRLREQCQFGHSSDRIGPVDIQPALRRISVRHGCSWTDPLATMSELAWLTQPQKEFDFKSPHWPSQFHYTG